MKLLSLISAFILIFCLQAQSPEHPCATMEANAQFATPAQRRANEAYLENYRKRHPEKKYLPVHYNTLQRRSHQCGVANIIIPVWVHVVHNNGIGNISEAQAEHAIEELNHHFSNADGTSLPAVNTGIQFYLAGFDTTVSSLTSHKRNVETVDLMSQKFRSKDTFVNIWVVKEILDSNGLNNNVLGFSGMPWTRFGGRYNGIVVEHDWFGHAGFGAHMHPDAQGKVLVHEMGHYLGLYHPFDFGCQGTTDNDCALGGDMCCDVPATNTNQSDCSNPTNSCMGENYSGNDPLDQMSNYMDYYEPGCKNTFTADQTTLMYSRLEQYHSTLGLPSSFIITDPDYCVVSAKIEGASSVCQGDSFRFTTYLVNNGTTFWQLFDSAGNFLDSFTGRNFVTIDTALKEYFVTLHSWRGGDDSYDTLRKVEVLDCNAHLPTPNGNWVFGNKAGLRFSPSGTFRDIGPSRSDNPSQLNISENSFCISDSMGNLLLYGGPDLDDDPNSSSGLKDIDIYGKNYKPITGSPYTNADYRKLISGTSAQGSILLNRPDSAHLYDLFYGYYIGFSDGASSAFLNKLTIDVSDSTYVPSDKYWEFGSIIKSDTISLNVLGNNNRRFGDAITALPKCNPSEYWLLVNDIKSEEILVYSVHGDTVEIDSAYPAKYWGAIFKPGLHIYDGMQIVFNQQGTKFAYDDYIYDFDRATGNISLSDSIVYDSLSQVWGIAWSPNGKVLYRSEVQASSLPGGIASGIFQYDLESSHNNKNRNEITQPDYAALMQTGPDGKVYIATERQPYLNSISKPNVVNYAGDNKSEFEEVGILLRKGSTGGISTEGSMPNIVNANVEVLDTNVSFYAKRSSCFTVNTESEVCCIISSSWNWGDGSSIEFGKKGTHTYGDTGYYTITQTINGTFTIQKIIHIGVEPIDLTINGLSQICDKSQTYNYFLPFKTNLQYIWSSENAAYQSALDSVTPNTEIQWNTTGKVKAIVLDNRTGCIDSGFLDVTVRNEILNNRIDSSQAICSYGDSIKQILGSMPTGGAGGLTYVWYAQPQNGTFRKLSNTGQHFTPIKNDTSYRYMRIVRDGICSKSSNIVDIVYLNLMNTIEEVTDNTSHWYRSADTNYRNSNFRYQWQQSTDSIFFTDIPPALSSSYYKTFIMKDSLEKTYIRRKITTDNCVFYSNILCHTPSVYPLSKYDARYCNSTTLSTGFAIKNRTLKALDYYWYRIKGGNPDSTFFIQKNNTPHLTDFSSNYTPSDLFKCVVKHSQVQDSIVIITKIYDTLARSLPEGPGVKITHWVKPGDDLSIPSSFVKLDRQSVFNGWEQEFVSTIWRFFTPDDTLKLTNIPASWDGLEFRAYANNTCFYQSGQTYISGTEYGPNHVIKIQDTTQYWIKDSHNDVGAEANWPDVNNYTHSPDVWVRQRSNYGTRVWGYMDQSMLKADADTNFMHVMVRNYGQHTAKGGKLYLYWTVNSTNESWPDKWLGVDFNDTFCNSDSAKCYPRSGRINKVGYEIDTIPPGDSLMVTIPWTQADTVPQPGWYYVLKDSQKNYSNTIGVCYLARIETADAYPHNMSYAEHKFTDKTIQFNVVWNRRIASNNFFLDYIRPPFDNQFGGWTFFYVKPKVGISPRDVKFKMHVNDPAYFGKGEILMHLSDYMWNKMSALSFPGSGFTVDMTNQTLLIDQNDAIIGNFDCDPDIQSGVAFTFRRKAGTSGGAATKAYLFTLSQYVEDSIHLGNMQYGLYGPPAGGGGGEGDPTGAPNPDGLQPTNTDLSILMANPNPFTGELHIQYQGGVNQKVQLQLFDMEGKLVSEICNCQSDDKGFVHYQLNGNAVSAGSYILKALENGVEKKMIVIKAE